MVVAIFLWALLQVVVLLVPPVAVRIRRDPQLLVVLENAIPILLILMVPQLMLPIQMRAPPVLTTLLALLVFPLLVLVSPLPPPFLLPAPPLHDLC